MKLEKYEIEHMEKVRKIAPECMVLLKSDGSFPLNKAGEIALYGSGARNTLKGGTGSGDVNVRAFTTVEQGLENAGFEITTKEWLDSYDLARREARKIFRAGIKEKIASEGIDRLMETLSIVMPEPDYDIPLNDEGGTALYILSRLCGEGTDRLDTAGDFTLSKTEIRDILQLEQQYDKFMLVLNVGGVVDLSPVADKVANILLLSQPGMTVGDSFADVLLGKAYPSGKLATTWAAREDYCDIGDFGGRHDTRYREGIYVGYRYFDTVGKKPLFPFGFGLGYSNFAISHEKPFINGTRLTVPAKVRNTGAYHGKEVAQLYASLPGKGLDQPYQVLAAFQKTAELAPGEAGLIQLSFDMESIASYDTQSGSRILEAGDYTIRIGSSSRETEMACVVRLDKTVTVEKLGHVGGSPDFQDWVPERATEIEQGGKEEAADKLLMLYASAFKEAVHIKPEPDERALALAKTLTDIELAQFCTGAFMDEGSKSVIGNSAISVAGAAGETTGMFRHLGVPNIIMADGPAGLRISREYGIDEQGVFAVEQEANTENFELLPEAMFQQLLAAFPNIDKPERRGEIHQQNCTAIPVAFALAQSWSMDAARECGDIVGVEMKRFGIHLWLAPAMNIQRNPLCGRNFEYFSEDPLLSGKMAAAITEGVQNREGLGVTIKHFVCNNQETNRFYSNSVVSERALREIYARGFEIVVKEANPLAIMSSYNLLNGEHTSQRHDLMETMLRDEWGFKGIVMSDFISGDNVISAEVNKYPKVCASGSIGAGNDIMMPGGKAHLENMLDALDNKDAKYPLKRENLEKCASRMIDAAWRLAVSPK